MTFQVTASSDHAVDEFIHFLQKVGHFAIVLAIQIGSPTLKMSQLNRDYFLCQTFYRDTTKGQRQLDGVSILRSHKYADLDRFRYIKAIILHGKFNLIALPLVI